jgi:RNA processing factor Prp31
VATATPEYMKLVEEMMKRFPVDNGALQDLFKSQAALADQMSKVTLEAVEKSTEVSTNWTKATLDKVNEMSRSTEAPGDYPTAMTDFASVVAEMAAEYVTAYSDIAKKAQLDTINLILSAGKEFQGDAVAAAEEATDAAAQFAASAMKDIDAVIEATNAKAAEIVDTPSETGDITPKPTESGNQM